VSVAAQAVRINALLCMSKIVNLFTKNVVEEVFVPTLIRLQTLETNGAIMVRFSFLGRSSIDLLALDGRCRRVRRNCEEIWRANYSDKTVADNYSVHFCRAIKSQAGMCA
jgi:hypothetical protein